MPFTQKILLRAVGPTHLDATLVKSALLQPELKLQVIELDILCLVKVDDTNGFESVLE